MTIFLKHLLRAWAVLRGDDLTALILSKEIIMADFTKLNAAADRVAAKVGADTAAIAQAAQDAANVQPEIDAVTAKLDAIAPEPAPVQ